MRERPGFGVAVQLHKGLGLSLATVQDPAARAGMVHEIKHDGYRLIVRRDGRRVRLFTRNGYDWTQRFS